MTSSTLSLKLLNKEDASFTRTGRRPQSIYALYTLHEFLLPYYYLRCSIIRVDFQAQLASSRRPNKPAIFSKFHREISHYRTIDKSGPHFHHLSFKSQYDDSLATKMLIHWWDRKWTCPLEFVVTHKLIDMTKGLPFPVPTYHQCTYTFYYRSRRWWLAPMPFSLHEYVSIEDYLA